jgi:hypothetical protein
MRKTFLTVSLALFTAASVARAGQVAVFPKRVVFGDRLRTAEVTLVNQGDRPLTYRIELIEQRMTPVGALEPAAPGERSALDLLRYSPRQVTVAPGAPQTIRLLLRKPEGLPPGEYRVHLLCRVLPSESAGADVESQGENNGLTVRLIPVPAVSIPVLVRHGEGLRGSVQLSGLTFDPDAQALSFRLEREGDVSVYGDLTAVFQPANGGPEQVVGKTRGMAVYTEIPSIQTRLALDPGHPLPDGRLLLRFASRPEDDGGGPVLSAEAEVQVP